MKHFLSDYSETAFRALVRTEADDQKVTRRDEERVLRIIKERLDKDDTPLPPITNLELVYEQFVQGALQKLRL